MTGTFEHIELYNPRWLDIPKIKSYGAVLNVIVGARRIGKTYGIIKDALENRNSLGRMLYLRHTKTQLELIAAGTNNPFLDPARDMKLDVGVGKDGPIWRCAFVEKRNNDGAVVQYGDIIADLSSVFSTRGISSGAYNTVFFDEFIPEFGTITRKHSGYNLKSAIHTITNASTTDVTIWLAANANNLDNDILLEFNLIRVFEELKRLKESGVNSWRSDDGYILAVDAGMSPVSSEMAETPIGSILNSGEYGGMAFYNSWANNDTSLVKPLNGQQLREYYSGLMVGDLLIFGHKNLCKFYVRGRIERPPSKVTHYEVNENTPKIMAGNYPALSYAYYTNNILFDSYESQIKFKKYVLGKDSW